MLDKLVRKQNLTQNSHSGSLKVIHFEITEKPTRDSVLLYNNAGLISEVSTEIASKIAENCSSAYQFTCFAKFGENH